MEYLSIIEQPTKEAIKIFAKKINIPGRLIEKYRHPQEDYLITSESPPIFVVADGVTLNIKKLIENNKKYPGSSPAGKVAKIFCKAIIKNTKEKYNKFNKSQIVNIFKEANKEVKKYNKYIGKSDICGNVTGFYSATGAFVVIKKNKAYWASICDSFVAHFDKNMNLKFISTGVCSPYAVINGEEKMIKYLEKGVLNLKDGDRVFIFTDGFWEYIKNNKFLKIFKNWSGNLKNNIMEFSKSANLKNPEKYGREKSLIAILI